MTRTPIDWMADRLISRTGSDARTEELRNHFDDERTAGRGASLADVASLVPLVARTLAMRSVRDLTWWIAGLPFVFLMFIILGLNHSLHFSAWDMVGVGEYPHTPNALFWRSAVNVAAVVGVVAAIPAGRRLIGHLKSGSWFALAVPATLVGLGALSLLFATFFAPESQATNFDPEFVNEFSPVSVGLFLALCAVPVLFLMGDCLRAASRGLQAKS